MDLRTEISYPGARIDDVVDMALNPEFRAAVCQATMAIDHDVDIQPGADGTTIVTVRRTVPAEVPDFVKKFVGDTIRIVQSEVWQRDHTSGTRRATLTIQIVGQPATMRGSLTLVETSDGVLEVVEGDLKVSVPFVGKTIEAEIAKGIQAAARKEQETGREWLAS